MDKTILVLILGGLILVACGVSLNGLILIWRALMRWLFGDDKGARF